MQNIRLVTISDHVEWAQSCLEQSDVCFGHGCNNSRDEAIWATLHVANLIEHDYEEIRDQSLTDEHSSKLRDLIELRIETRKPLAYLIQESWFAGLAFYVDERAIVPRSHFGDLIQDGFGPWVRSDNVNHVLDLCTGSGCIAVAMAMHYPDAKVDAVDIDLDALDVARINIEHYECGERVRVIQGDLFDSVRGSQYDLIVCNPPYVDSSEFDSLPVEYHHEPRLALEAGESGLEIVKQILRQAVDYLSDHGYLLVELGDSSEALEAEYDNIPFLWLTSRSGESVVLLISAEELKMHRFSLQKS